MNFFHQPYISIDSEIEKGMMAFAGFLHSNQLDRFFGLLMTILKAQPTKWGTSETLLLRSEFGPVKMSVEKVKAYQNSLNRLFVGNSGFWKIPVASEKNILGQGEFPQPRFHLSYSHRSGGLVQKPLRILSPVSPGFYLHLGVRFFHRLKSLGFLMG